MRKNSFFLILQRKTWKIKEKSLSLQAEPINRNDSMKPNHNQKSKTSPFDSLRIIFVLFALLSSQTLFSQDLENRRVPVAGFFSDVYDKEEIEDYYVNQYKRETGASSYSIAIDFTHMRHLIVSEIDGHVLFEKIPHEVLLSRSHEMNSDTVCIYPDPSYIFLYEKCGFELPFLKKVDYIKECALKFSPYYISNNNKKLFRCFYFKGTALIKDISKIDKGRVDWLLHSYAIGKLSSKRFVLVIDDIQTYNPYVLLGELPIWFPNLEIMDKSKESPERIIETGL